MIYDCAVIGAGPAGIIASLQLKRAGYKVAIFERKKIGGLLYNANKIENYLGFKEGVSGPMLAFLFINHLNKFKIKIIKENVLTIENTGKNHCGLFNIYTTKSKKQAKSVILATGTSPNQIGILGETALAGKKLFYELKDLPLTKQKSRVAIIGGGDMGVDYAINLYQQKHQPFILTKNEIKCIDVLKKRIKKLRIPYFEKINPIQLRSKREKIEIFCEGKKFATDFILVAVGRHFKIPKLNVFNKEGIFLAFNPKNKNHWQVHVSTGYGMEAALQAIKYLQKK